MRRVVTVVLVLCMTVQVWSRRRDTMKADGVLKDQISQVLKATNDMHGALIDQDEAKIATKLQMTLQTLGRAVQRSGLAHEEQPHLKRMLQVAQSNLQMVQMQSGQKRQRSLKKAFAQLVNLAKAYRIDNYRIFFCPKDKSVWIQKSWKPKNPIHPSKYPDCGKLVGRT